nr:T9SS type A sorting domain-containing protein [Bacteroidaceae bacterium]
LGSHSMSDLAVYGIPDKAIASVEVTEGYRVKMYKSKDCSGSFFRTDKSRTALTGTFSGSISSLSIELLDDAVEAPVGAQVRISVGCGMLHVANAAGQTAAIFDTSGRIVAEKPITSSQAKISLSPLPKGMYVVRVGETSATVSL